MDTEIRDDVLIELSDDYVHLWSIIDRIKDNNKELDSFSVRKKTVSFVKEMLNEQLMQAGNFDTESKFQTWDISSLEVVRIIEEEWIKLGREPNPWEIVWFISTPKGYKKAKLLNI